MADSREERDMSEDDVLALGDPFARPKKSKTEDAAPPVALEPQSCTTFRGEDPELDCPPPGPIQGTRLSSEEFLGIEEAQRRDDRRKAEEEVEMLQRSFNSLAWLRPLLAYPALCFVALVASVSLSQTGMGISAAFSLPFPFSWIMGGILLALFVIVLAICGYVLYSLFHLRRSNVWDLDVFRRLEERRVLRDLASRQRRDAVASLTEYMRKYDLNPSRASGVTRSLGLTREDLSDLVQEREWLLAHADSQDSASWIRDFQVRFQNRLDQAADKLIGESAKRCGLATAISPDRTLDRIIVLGHTMGLLAQLLELYGLRPSKLGSLTLLTAAFSQAYLAGHVQEVAEDVAEWGPDILVEQCGQGMAGIFKSVGAKAGEGAVHYLMVRRLGRSAMRQIQPTRPRKQ